MPPVIAPPFTLETAQLKVRAAEDAWNSRDPDRVVLAYTPDSIWRNRSEFLRGREQIRAFLARKWSKEHEYRLAKELWGFRENRMAVRFQYEWRDDAGQWFRSYGNELWEFDDAGLMRRREASINDLSITEADRRYRWDAGAPRSEGAPGVESPEHSRLLTGVAATAFLSADSLTHGATTEGGQGLHPGDDSGDARPRRQGRHAPGRPLLRRGGDPRRDPGAE